jgi:hypothetical protein
MKSEREEEEERKKKTSRLAKKSELLNLLVTLFPSIQESKFTLQITLLD